MNITLNRNNCNQETKKDLRGSAEQERCNLQPWENLFDEFFIDDQWRISPSNYKRL